MTSSSIWKMTGFEIQTRDIRNPPKLWRSKENKAHVSLGVSAYILPRLLAFLVSNFVSSCKVFLINTSNYTKYNFSKAWKQTCIEFWLISLPLPRYEFFKAKGSNTCSEGFVPLTPMEKGFPPLYALLFPICNNSDKNETRQLANIR